jgi:hypothetical protein
VCEIPQSISDFKTATRCRFEVARCPRSGAFPSLEDLAQRERDLFDDPEQVKLRAEMRNHMRVALGVRPVEEKAAAIDFEDQDRRARQLLGELGHLLDD